VTEFRRENSKLYESQLPLVKITTFYYNPPYSFMAERQRPEIPQHLKDSVRSAGAYEQDERRSFQSADKAWRLRIPQASLGSYEGVRRYVGVLRDLALTGERRGREPLVVYDALTAREQARHDMKWTVATLHGAASTVLEDGFLPHWRENTVADLQSQLNDVAKRYGAQVKYGPVAGIPDSEPPRGAWTTTGMEAMPDVPWPDRERRWPGQSIWWYERDVAGERYDPEQLSRVGEEAKRQGLPEQVVQTDPVTHALLAELVHARDVAREVSAVENLWLPPGLAPSATKRLATAAPLTQLAVAALEEEFQPGTLAPELVIDTLATVGGAYGLLTRHNA